MQRKRITNYEYINSLVQEIQVNATLGKATDEAFTELCNVYNPLLNKYVRHIIKSPGNKMPANDVFIIVLGLFFKLILRYDGKFSNTSTNVSGYTGVYFSSYLRQTLGWEVYRLTRPSKRETDSLEKDLPYMELSALIKNNSRRLVFFDTPKGITSDFINMCEKLRKTLCSDIHADMMFLLYGYDAKVKDLSRIFKLSSTRTTKYIAEIHDFWKQPENGLQEN